MENKLRLLFFVLAVGLAFQGLSTNLSRNEKSVHVAKVVLQEKNWEETSLLDYFQGHPRAILWRGIAALATGDLEKAAAFLEDGVRQFPENALLRNLLGDVYERQGRIPEAIKEWERAESWYEMIRAIKRSLSDKRWQDAMLMIDATRDSRPEEVVRLQAQALAGMGEYSSAVSLLQESMVSWPASGYRQNWLVLLGDYLGQEEYWDDAGVAYQQAVEIGGSLTWTAYIGLGQALYYSGQGPVAALEKVNQGIAMEPDRPEGYVVLAEIYQAEEAYDEADIRYQKAIELSPSNSWYWVMRGDNALEAGNLPLAIQVLEETTRRFPEFARAYYSLARAYKKAGEIDKALVANEKLVALAPEEDAWYWVTAGQLYEQTDQLDQALAAYQAALAIDPANVSAQDGLRRVQGER